MGTYSLDMGDLAADAAKIFSSADKDGDDTLTKSEIKKYASTPAGSSLKSLFDVKNSGWAKLWEAVDTDGDGQFSLEEFTNAYVAAVKADPDNCKSIPAVKGFRLPTIQFNATGWGPVRASRKTNSRTSHTLLLARATVLAAPQTGKVHHAHPAITVARVKCPVHSGTPTTDRMKHSSWWTHAQPHGHSTSVLVAISQTTHVAIHEEREATRTTSSMPELSARFSASSIKQSAATRSASERTTPDGTRTVCSSGRVRHQLMCKLIGRFWSKSTCRC